MGKLVNRAGKEIELYLLLLSAELGLEWLVKSSVFLPSRFKAV